MSQGGRRRKATAEQRAEVERLAAGGLSIRRIATQVFGDERFRGRVERILSAPRLATPSASVQADVSLSGVDASAMTTPDLVRLLLRRRLEEAATEGEVPSCTELRNLLDLQRRLEAFEFVERAKARARSGRGER